jgi:hypothetical protein
MIYRSCNEITWQTMADCINIVLYCDLRIQLSNGEVFFIFECPYTEEERIVNVRLIRKAFGHKYKALFDKYDVYMNKPLVFENLPSRMIFDWDQTKLSEELMKMSQEYIIYHGQQLRIEYEHISNPRRCITPPSPDHWAPDHYE